MSEPSLSASPDAGEAPAPIDAAKAPPEVATVQVVLPNIGPFDAVPVAR